MPWTRKSPLRVKKSENPVFSPGENTLAISKFDTFAIDQRNSEDLTRC